MSLEIYLVDLIILLGINLVVIDWHWMNGIFPGRRVVLWAVALAIALMGGFGSLRAATSRPNVLLVMTDDQGYGDLGVHGNTFLDTPRIDALSKESVRLSRFYVSPVCAPTRASLLTGRYHLRTGAVSVTRREEAMRSEEVTLAELFQAEGYETAAIGKWHNGSFYPETPRAQGFHDFYGFRFGHTNRYFDPVLEENGIEVQREGYITDLLTNYAIDFISRKKELEQPFFCYLAYNAPHTPALPPQALYEKYRSRGLSECDAAIYGMVENLDQNVGRLLDHLDSEGLAENTIVIFLTDNGPNFQRYNSGLKGRKAQFDEGGVRVPFFLRWPERYPNPGEIDEPLAHIDLLPTLVDWCGLGGASALELDGRSFVSLFDDPRAIWPDRLLYFFPFGKAEAFRWSGSVRTQRWLAVRSKKDWELFDLIVDQGQTRDLAETYPWVLEMLSSRYETLLAELEPAHMPTPIPLGYAEAPIVEIGAHDAILHESGNKGGIAYNFPAGYANHWITNWTETEAYPEWTLDVVEEGRYAATLLYGLREGSGEVAGKLSVSDSREYYSFRIDRVFDEPAYEQPFILSGEASKYASKPWGEASLGDVELSKGEARLSLRLDSIPLERGFELKALRLEKR